MGLKKFKRKLAGMPETLKPPTEVSLSSYFEKKKKKKRAVHFFLPYPEKPSRLNKVNTNISLIYHTTLYMYFGLARINPN